MMTLMRNGGFPMYFIVAFGLVALGAAARFALKPDARRLGFVRGMSAATWFSVLAGLAAALATVCYHVAADDKLLADPQWPRLVFQGCAESLSPVIVGATLLSLTALLSAVGRGRMSDPAA